MSERSKRILKSIEDSHLSYGELSKLTNISKSALQRYATGETEKVPIDRLEVIAKVTGVTSSYLMGWEIQDDLDKIASDLDMVYNNNDIQALIETCSKYNKKNTLKRLMRYAEFLLNEEENE